MKNHIKITVHLVILATILPSIITAPNCTSARTCSECISVDKDCKWCSGPSLKPEQRCKSAHRNCPSIIDPPFSNLEVADNRPFSDDIHNPVQLKPQKIE